MRSYLAKLKDLHSSPGFNAFFTCDLHCDYEVQVHAGCVCRVTYLCIMSTDESGDTYSPFETTFPKSIAENQNSQSTVIFDVEDWDVESSPLEDGAHERMLADLIKKNANISPKKKTKSVFHECDSFSQSDTPEETTASARSTRKETRAKYTVHKKNTRKLYIRNINFRTTQNKLWSFFTKFGDVEFCQLCKDRGKFKGRGYVCFRDEKTAESVLKLDANSLILDKRTLQLESYVIRKYESDPKYATYQNLAQGSSSAAGDASGMRLCRPEARVALTPEEPDLINSLPEEVLVYLFSFLTLKQRFLCERVCKRWREINLIVWRSLETLKLRELSTRFGGLNDRQFRRLLKRGCPVLKSIDLSTCSRSLTDGALDAIGHYCRSVQYLDLSGMSITNKGLGILAEKQLPLQRVHLKNCYEVGEKGLWWLFHRCKDLKELSLDNNKRVTGQCFHVLCYNVLKLSLTGCSKLQDLALDKIRLRSRELDTLNLDDCVSLSDAGLRHVSQIRTLKVLYLTGIGHNVTTSGVESLSALACLEELHVPNNHAVSDTVLCALAAGCKQLRVLNVAGCHLDVTDEGLSSLAQCPQLHTLNISYIHRVGSGLVAVARDCRLVDLCARGCGALTNDDLVSVAGLAVSLERLDVCGCDQLTTVVLDSLRAAVTGDDARRMHVTVGGTHIYCDPASLPTNLSVDMSDYCLYNLRPDQDISLFLGSDESEEEANDLEDYFDVEGGDLYDYLVAQDPMLEAELELS